MIPNDTKVRITWEMRRGDVEFVGSINEMRVNTVAQAVTWIMKELPKRDRLAVLSSAEVDLICLDEIGNFCDDEGCPRDFRPLGRYDPAEGEWVFTEY